MAERAKSAEQTVLQACLYEAWEWYDLGGISHGRSVRSALLEASQTFFRNGDVARGRECLAALVALHLEPKRQTGWYDGPPDERFPFGSLKMLSLLVRAGIEAGVRELPDVSEEFGPEQAMRLTRP